MRVSGANQAVWRTGGGRMRVSGANQAVWRTRAARWRYCFKKYQKIGSANKGAARRIKKRRGDRRSGREVPKGVCGQRRGLGALGLK